jgi:hypothetical protein
MGTSAAAQVVLGSLRRLAIITRAAVCGRLHRRMHNPYNPQRDARSKEAGTLRLGNLPFGGYETSRIIQREGSR